MINTIVLSIDMDPCLINLKWLDVQFNRVSIMFAKTNQEVQKVDIIKIPHPELLANPERVANTLMYMKLAFQKLSFAQQTNAAQLLCSRKKLKHSVVKRNEKTQDFILNTQDVSDSALIMNTAMNQLREIMDKFILEMQEARKQLG